MVYFHVNHAKSSFLEMVSSRKFVVSIESMRLFISSTPDFQVLSVNEQQSLFERNLHGIPSLCSNIFFRDIHFLDNPECYSSFITIYGLEIIK
jgi:hypothetical protein